MQKEAKGARRALTANRLRDGRVVFLTEAGDWSTDIQQAAVAEDREAMARLEAAGAAAQQAQLVVGAYLIDVERSDGRLWPTRWREQIRAAGGPTVPAGPDERRVA